MAFRWMSGLINHLYLQFYHVWHAAKPRTASLTYSPSCTAVAIWGVFCFGYLDRFLCTSAHYSVLGVVGRWKPLGRASETRTSLLFLIIPWISSWRTTLNSLWFLVLHDRGSVPLGSLQWSMSYLVWFPWWPRRGAMDPCAATPLWEILHRPDFWNYTF